MRHSCTNLYRELFVPLGRVPKIRTSETLVGMFNFLGSHSRPAEDSAGQVTGLHVQNPHGGSRESNHGHCSLASTHVLCTCL